ncbi:MAG: glycosyltransferase [Elusimicrobia bacterium]|nr:glycosyltransferase [Elusimicrobiota bacterium]
MTEPAVILSALSALGSAALWACLLATLRHFRGAPQAPCRLPMTLIRPVRGLHDGLVEALESLAAADPLKSLQVVLSVEGEGDPAYPALEAFCRAHPDRAVEIVRAGPPGARMGKIHNMIAALPRAARPFVIFSDADARISRALLADAARAFEAGADSVHSAPYYVPPRGVGEWLYAAAFNHVGALPAALSWRLGVFFSFSGAFMGYTREALARLGGLERFEREIADDAALGLAARRAGLRQELLRAPAFVRETGTSPREAFAHLAKWAAIVFWVAPAAWIALPFLSPVLLALAALGLAARSGSGAAAAAAALAGALASRVLVAWIQDRRVGGYRLGLGSYWRLALLDLGGLLLWPFGLRRVVSWRGRRYRLFPGGRCAPIET